MAVNIGSIMGKVQAFSKTTVGQKKIDNAISYIRGHGGVSAAGGRVRTAKDIDAAANVMERLIRASAGQSGLPSSVFAELSNGLTHGAPVVSPDGQGRVGIYIYGDTYRPSLDPARYGGIDNIIALFNNGYKASDYVYGNWHGNRIKSTISRPGLQFMQAAVSDFNSGYGAANDIVAKLSGEYE